MRHSERAYLNQSKDYASDSTLVSSPQSKARRRLASQKTATSSAADPSSRHPPPPPTAAQNTNSHSHFTPTRLKAYSFPRCIYAPASSKSSDASPLGPGLTGLATGSRFHSSEQDESTGLKRPLPGKETAGEAAPLRRERHRALRRDPRLAAANSHKALSAQRRTGRRRHSLGLRGTGAKKGDPFPLQDRDGPSTRVADKTALLRRSHSFCGSASGSNSQWTVYGYV